MFDESRTNNIPDGGEAAEMNANRALAVMAWLLSGQSTKYTTGEKPNALAIATAVEPLALQIFGDDTKGFKAFNKRLGKALKLFEQDQEFNF